MSAIEQPAGRVPTTGVVRALVWLQAFFWGSYLIVLIKLLTAGYRYGGFGFRPFGDDPTLFDPKDVFGWGIPEYLMHGLLLLTVWFGAVPATLLLIASLRVTVMLWHATAPRRWLLTFSSVMTLAFLAVQLTSFHSLIVEWLMD
jgi:hypothetical protein